MADALSRRPDLKDLKASLDAYYMQTLEEDLEHITEWLNLTIVSIQLDKQFLNNMKLEYMQDPKLNREKLPPGVRYDHHTELYMVADKIYIPADDELKNSIIKKHHDIKTAGHNGILRTEKLIKRNFCWPHMHQNIKTYIRNCKVCKLTKQPAYTCSSSGFTATTANTNRTMGIFQS